MLIKKNCHVVVGVIINPKQEILIAYRKPHLPQGGVWEFPGGKVENNESHDVALCRELQEEIGITVTQATVWMDYVHEYPERGVHLWIWKVTAFYGEPEGRENQEIRWVPLNELSHYDFPAGNKKIISLLRSV